MHASVRTVLQAILTCLMYPAILPCESRGAAWRQVPACNPKSERSQVSAQQAEQWFEAATISAEAAELGGEEEEEQPEAASPAEPLPVVAL